MTEVNQNELTIIKVNISNPPIERDFQFFFFLNTGIGYSQKLCQKQSHRKIENEDTEQNMLGKY